MYYIQTNDNGVITQCATVGAKPAVNGHEIEDIPENILKNIFSYKYINNEFVLIEDRMNEKFNKVKARKIEAMSSICNQVIENGIDYNGEHYSLTTYDQIMISGLKQIGKDGGIIKYHPDNGDCRIYTLEEFSAMVSTAEAFIDYQRTYFNKLKADINDINNMDDLVSVYYGQPLSPERQTSFEQLVAGVSFETISIPDTTNYDNIINDINSPPIALL